MNEQKQKAMALLQEAIVRYDIPCGTAGRLTEAIEAIPETPPVPAKLAEVLARLECVLDEHSWVDDDERDALLGMVAALPVAPPVPTKLADVLAMIVCARQKLTAYDQAYLGIESIHAAVAALPVMEWEPMASRAELPVPRVEWSDETGIFLVDDRTQVLSFTATHYCPLPKMV